MNIALWIVQGLLAAVFLYSGTAKLTWPKERMLASGQTGVGPIPLPVIRLTAAAELIAVVGLIMPRATGIAPSLTAAAAIGLMVVMIGAMTSHSTLLRADLNAGRGSREARNIALNATILALCIFVAVGRI
ncbi:MAG TPA: DoxX family protein [Actinocrinis sp.]